MSEKILYQRPPLTHLDFGVLVTNEETAQQGERLLNILASTTIPTLLSLNLGWNNELWEDKARFNLLLDLLQQQDNLVDLDLPESLFSAMQTEQLLR